MRNLKKLLAVIMAVAMLASIMVPALAADYDDDAQKLYNLGLFKGSSGSSYQPDLDGKLTREQGLTLMIRAMGKDEEALGMSEAEINEQLAKVEDAADITDWARPYVAYAVKNGLTKGIGGATPPNIKFGAQLDLSGKEFINFMLYAMGYTDAWDIVLDKAVEIGMLTAGEAVKFGSMDVIIRDVAIGIMAGSMGGTTAAGITLAQALVEAGVVTEEAMVEAGYMDPIVTPTPEPVVLTAEAYTDNLIQVYVVYSQEVDKDSAEDVDNYTLVDSEIADASLSDDGVTVVLTLKENRDQQDVADLTIKNVKDLNGTAIDETTVEVAFLDTTIPTILDANVVGKDTFKVIFSEPMDKDELDEDAINVTADGSKMYINQLIPQSNNTEVLIKMYSNFEEGEVTLKIGSKFAQDYAGFSVIGKTFNLTVTPDEDAPEVIGYEKAKRDQVTLIWSEDIVVEGTNEDGELTAEDLGLDMMDDFYHTNSKNGANKITVDGNKMTIEFLRDEDNDIDTWLPAGTAYVYVLKEAVMDLWDNENDQQMIKIEVELDEDPPEIDGSIEVKYVDEDAQDATRIVIKFTETLNSDAAEDEDNYVVLNSKGDEINNKIDDISYDGDKKVTIDFNEELDYGDYSLVIKNVEDIYGNKMPSTEITFSVGDIKPPVADNFEAVIYNAGEEGQMLKVSFGEKMATTGKYSINDVEKYVVDDENLADIEDVKIKVVDDGEAVEITIPHEELEVQEEGSILEIARVADAAGNYMKDLRAVRPIIVTDEIEIVEAEATGPKTIKVKFSDNVAKFDAKDIKFRTVSEGVYSTEELKVAQVSTALDGGKTVATFTLKEELNYDATSGEDNLAVVVSVEGQKSENVYEKKLQIAKYPIDDKIAPKVDEVEFEDNKIIITYTEALEADDEDLVKLYAQDLIVKNRDGDTLKPGIDYTTEVAGKELIVTVIKDNPEHLYRYTVESKSDIQFIQDDIGNLAQTFSKERNTTNPDN